MSGETVTIGRSTDALSGDEGGTVMPMPEPRKTSGRTILMCVCLGTVQVILAAVVLMDRYKTKTSEQAFMNSIEALKASIEGRQPHKAIKPTQTPSGAIGDLQPKDKTAFEEMKAAMEVMKASIEGLKHGSKTAKVATKIPADATAFADGILFHNCNKKEGSAAPAKFFQFAGAMNEKWRADGAVKILEHFGRLKDKARIVDMGAGYHALQSALPPGYPYQAVDVQERVPGSGTLLCNVNQGQFPFFSENIAAFVFLGSFEYMLHKLAILTMCRRQNAPVVMQYNVGVARNSGSFQWVAPMDGSQLVEAAQRAGYKLHWPSCLIHDLPLANPCQNPQGGSRGAYIYFEPV